MTQFEQVELAGQTTIFDFLEFPPSLRRNNAFLIGDKVKIRFYIDELYYIEQSHQQLLGIGEIVGKKFDFYIIQIGEQVVEVPGDKLILV